MSEGGANLGLTMDQSSVVFQLINPLLLLFFVYYYCCRYLDHWVV